MTTWAAKKNTGEIHRISFFFPNFFFNFLSFQIRLEEGNRRIEEILERIEEILGGIEGIRILEF